MATSKYYNTDTYLQSVLRKDFSPESLSTQEQQNDCARLLKQKAYDFILRHPAERQNYKNLDEVVQNAIDRFLANWNGKQHGDDPRGLTSLGHLTTHVQDVF